MDPVSVALWVLSAVVGAVYLGPRVKRASELFETEGPISQEGRELIDRLFVVSRLELVGFAVIIALMTFKRGLNPSGSHHQAEDEHRYAIGVHQREQHTLPLPDRRRRSAGHPASGFPQFSYQYRHLVPALARRDTGGGARHAGLGDTAGRHGSRTTHSRPSAKTSRHWSTPSAIGSSDPWTRVGGIVAAEAVVPPGQGDRLILVSGPPAMTLDGRSITAGANVSGAPTSSFTASRACQSGCLPPSMAGS